MPLLENVILNMPKAADARAMRRLTSPSPPLSLSLSLCRWHYTALETELSNSLKFFAFQNNTLAFGEVDFHTPFATSNLKFFSGKLELLENSGLTLFTA